MNTDEVASKLAIVLSIIRPFWLIYVGLRTIYGKRAHVKKPKWPNYTQDDRNFRCDLTCTITDLILSNTIFDHKCFYLSVFI